MGFLKWFNKRDGQGADADRAGEQAAPPQPRPAAPILTPKAPPSTEASKKVHWEVPRALLKAVASHKVPLSSDELGLLSEDLRPLAAVRASLPDEALRYITTGEGERVLERIAAAKECAEALRPIFWTWRNLPKVKLKDSPPPRWRFLYTTKCRDPVLFLRLALVYHAASMSDSDVQAHWLVPFVNEADYHTFPLEVVLAMLRLAGEPEGVLARVVVLKGDGNEFGGGWHLAGWGDYIHAHLDVVRKALSGWEEVGSSNIEGLLKDGAVPVGELLPELVRRLDDYEASMTRNFSVHRRVHSAALRELLRNARWAPPEERVLALRCLVKYSGDASRAVLRTRAAFEGDPLVKGVIAELLGRMPAEERPPSHVAAELGLKPMDEVSLVAPPPESVHRALYRLMEEHNRDVDVRDAQLLARGEPPRRDDRWTGAEMDTAFDHLADIAVLAFEEKRAYGSRHVSAYHLRLREMGDDSVTGVLDLDAAFQKHYLRLMEEPDLLPIHVFRLRAMRWVPGMLDRHRETHGRRLGLREYAAVGQAMGFDPKYFIGDYLWSGRVQWEAEAIWPFFAEHMNDVVELLRPKTPEWGGRPTGPAENVRLAIWDLLAKFPRIPSPMVPFLFKYALGKNPKDRAPTQALLMRLPDLEGDLVGRLSSGDSNHRLLAAEWLSRVGTERSRKPLQEQLEREGDEGVRGQLIGALAHLGVPVSMLAGGGDPLKEAEEYLSKGVPKEMAWFPFDSMPPVRWEDGRRPVDPKVLKWLVLRSFRLKTPAPDAVLRSHCGRMVGADRQAWGRFVLERWIEHDTIRQFTDAEVEAMVVKWKNNWPEAYRNWKRHYETRFIGHANAQKGILAVTSATAGADIVPIVEGYQKAHSQERWRQCNDLSEALSWTGEPLAIQSLLRTASRHRTKVVRKEAARFAAQVAERQGWTMDQLEDRTIPTGGFDEGRELVLDYGSRRFFATVDRDLKVVVRTEGGKVLRSVPSAGKDDDPVLAKEARCALSEGKKELKAMVGRQKERLFEAMCTQREWPFPEWDTYLNRHPVVSYLCQGLVWAAYREGRIEATFRPMEDMSLTDVDDNEVTLGPQHSVRLAHALSVPPDAAEAWGRHLKDYKVKPTFGQFGRETYALPEGMRASEEITEFDNYVLNALIIGQTAGKQGFHKGPVEDENMLFTFVKDLPSTGLQAVIRFSGCQHFLMDQEVALRGLHFNRLGPGASTGGLLQKAPLGEVPPILLSETYALMRQIALKGQHRPDFKSDFWEG